MFQFEAGSFQYRKKDESQNNKKTNTNSSYGALLEKTFILFDVNFGSAITNNGYLTTSTMISTLETIVGNYCLDDETIITYMMSLILYLQSNNFSYETADFFVPKNFVNPRKQFKQNLFKSFIGNNIEFAEKYVDSVLSNLTDTEVTYCYFINNSKELMNTPIMHDFASECYSSSFLDPNKPPKEIAENLADLSEVFNMFAMSFFKFNITAHAKTIERENVLVTDTDSVFVYLKHLFENLFKSKGFDKIKHVNKRDQILFELCYLNIYIYLFDKYIRAYLYEFSTRVNMAEEDKRLLDMKNEFVLISILITNAKKWYASKQVLREGKLMFPPKISITGLSFKKKMIPKETNRVLEKLTDEILEYENFFEVVAKLKKFEQRIKDSLQTEYKYYLKKVLNKGYSDPYTQEIYRGMLLWNYLSPEDKITEYMECFIVKLDSEKVAAVVESENDSSIKQAYIDLVIEHPNMADKMNVIAIPKLTAKLPDEFKELISDDMVSLNIGTFNVILESFGVHVGTNNQLTSFIYV
jgi:hypothetical protein